MKISSELGQAGCVPNVATVILQRREGKAITTGPNRGYNLPTTITVAGYTLKLSNEQHNGQGRPVLRITFLAFTSLEDSCISTMDFTL
jgi:hypothetical protein